MALFVSSPLASGDRLVQHQDGSHRGITLKTERHQTALRGQALARSRAGTASPIVPLSREMLDVAPQKPLRADEPVTQNDELGPRRVTTGNPAGAAGIETRVRFWCGWLPAAPASVSLHSVVGPQQSFHRCGNRCCRKRGRTPSGSIVGSSVTSLGANPTEWGP